MTTLVGVQKKSNIFFGSTRDFSVGIPGWLPDATVQNRVWWGIVTFFVAAILVYLAAFYSLFSYQFRLAHATDELARSGELVSKSEFAFQQKKIELSRHNEDFENTFEKISDITYIVPSSVASSEIRPRP